jgi:CubicO group peptidase (beta-lactamase class C family)/ketosteroid isomerase-like protein
MTEDASWRIPGKKELLPTAGVYTKERIARLFRRILMLLSTGLRMNVISSLAEGDRVALGSLPRRPEERSPLSAEYRLLAGVQGGKICAVREYLNTQHAHGYGAPQTRERKYASATHVRTLVTVADIEMESTRQTADCMVGVQNELIAREPIFHRAEQGTTRAVFDQMIGCGFLGCRASGQRYSKQYVLDTLEQRYAEPHEDVWRAEDFYCQEIAPKNYLFTYALYQAQVTRRATIWRRTPDGWSIVITRVPLSKPSEYRSRNEDAAIPDTEFQRTGLACGAMLVCASVLVAACATMDAKQPALRATPALRPVNAAAMQGAVERLAKEMLVPGAVVILRTPNGNFATTYGVTTYRGTVPTGFEQHVRVGSNTKTWTGTVILQQIQEGLLGLNDPVSKYRPDVPNGGQITIEHLLAMRSGLHNYTTTLQLNRTLDEQPAKAWTQDELLALGYKNRRTSRPGGSLLSNTNTVLLGLIAEQREGGKPLAAIMRDRLFAPLGLKNTLFPTSRQRYPRAHARLHVRKQRADDGLAAFSAERHAGRGPRGHARARRLHRGEPVVGLGGRRGHLHRQRPRRLGGGIGQRQAAEPRLAGPAAR